MSTSGQIHLNEKTHRLALTSSLLYFIFQLLDILLTFLISPQLHRETNIMVARFGYGWDFILLSAAVACVIMLLTQLWLWKNLSRRFPSSKLGYRDFYHHLLFQEKHTSTGHLQLSLKGVLMGIVLILLYSLIAAKLFAVVWNALLLIFSIDVNMFILVILLKNLLAGAFGLYMFFVYLYFLHRLKHIS